MATGSGAGANHAKASCSKHLYRPVGGLAQSLFHNEVERPAEEFRHQHRRPRCATPASCTDGPVDGVSPLTRKCRSSPILCRSMRSAARKQSCQMRLDTQAAACRARASNLTRSASSALLHQLACGRWRRNRCASGATSTVVPVRAVALTHRVAGMPVAESAAEATPCWVDLGSHPVFRPCCGAPSQCGQVHAIRALRCRVPASPPG